jgi:hypothetical protein
MRVHDGARKMTQLRNREGLGELSTPGSIQHKYLWKSSLLFLRQLIHPTRSIRRQTKNVAHNNKDANNNSQSKALGSVVLKTSIKLVFKSPFDWRRLNLAAFPTCCMGKPSMVHWYRIDVLCSSNNRVERVKD